MAGQLEIRGVPQSLQRDAWWLAEEASADAADVPKPATGKPGGVPLPRLKEAGQGLALLVALVALADLSFWEQEPGLSIALFCLALSAAMLLCRPKRATRRDWALGMGFAAFCNLPVLEQVQALSVMFSLLGVSVLLGWIVFERRFGAWQVFVLQIRTTFLGAFLLPRCAVQDLRGAGGPTLWRVAQTAVLPLSFGFVFLVLLAAANPVLDRALADLFDFDAPAGGDGRIFFWLVLLCLLFPYLNAGWLRAVSARKDSATQSPDTPSPAKPGVLITPSSVMVSLLLFNALFLVQTLSDLTILIGGAELPEGMTYAEYAHRGAYPLVVTALLAGLFTVLSHRMIRDNGRLRQLVYLWLGQNMFLVVTAWIRLTLYVQVYALTHLRLATYIWMALVLIALVLIIVQIAQARPLGWMLRRNAVLGLATLYLCCFVNFTHIIVAYNLEAQVPVSGMDMRYLCELGEQAIPAMIEHGQVTDGPVCGRDGRAALRFDPIETWQEWGFRRWRLQRYLQAHHDL